MTTNKLSHTRYNHLNFLIFIVVLVSSALPQITYGQKTRTKSLEEVYLIDHDGADIKKLPDSLAETISSAEYGQLLNVVKTYKNWLLVSVPNSDASGYVRKNVVASENKIPLTKADLAEVYNDGNEPIEPYPNIELNLISKQQFDLMKKTSINYFLADTNVIKKHKKTIKLPIKKGFKILTDKPDYNKIDWNENEYTGQYPVINKYVVANSDGEAEDFGYHFIDKTTGKNSQVSFNGFPFLSADKNSIMSLMANTYHNYAELDLFRFGRNGKIIWYANGEFKNWMPAPTDDQFWGTDNCFYSAIIPSLVYFATVDAKKPAGYNYRYIKIKIKGPSVKKTEDGSIVTN